MNRIRIIRANGTEHTIEQDWEPTLKELQGWVGGNIELVRTSKDNGGMDMIVNEEGKLDGLPLNEKATELYGNPNDEIVGDAVICENFNLS